MSWDDRVDPIDILLIEDNPGDIRLMEEAVEEISLDPDLHVVRRGDKALDYLHQRNGYEHETHPNLVLLDLNLPGTHGVEVLEEIKSSPDLKRLPVIVLSSSDAEDDVVTCYEHHANAYLTKPLGLEAFVTLARTTAKFWMEMAQLPPTQA